MDAKKIQPGSERNVWAICRRDRPIYQEDVWDDISEEKRDDIDLYIKRISDYRQPIGDKRLKTPIRGYQKLFEMNPFGVRLFYFFIGEDIYITSACKKKNTKENRNDYKRADDIRNQFHQLVGEG